jgi:hypothetical protein
VPGELEVDTAVDRLVAGICSLRWPTAEGTAFPGDGLLRCSCDVASGAAGIALVLHRVATGGPSADLRSGRALARVRAGAPA